MKTIGKLKHRREPADPLCDLEAQKESLSSNVRRKHWFLGTKKYVTGALQRCADIMPLKPITNKGGRMISPVEQIRMQNHHVEMQPCPHLGNPE
jgi:hypothetical protein